VDEINETFLVFPQRVVASRVTRFSQSTQSAHLTLNRLNHRINVPLEIFYIINIL